MLSGLMLPIGLAVVAFILFGLLVSGGKKNHPAPPAAAPAFDFSQLAHHKPANVLTAREQDRNVQAELIAKYYAEAIDERFKQNTLDDVAALLAARKP